MQDSKRVRHAPLILIALGLLVAGSLIGPSFHISGHIRPSLTRQPATGSQTQLGFDCGLGTKEAMFNSSGYPVASSENGVFGLKTACNWIGDVGQTLTGISDNTNEPLVSDQDETLSTTPKIGGGFTADIVYLQNATSTLNGFDITVSWNPNVLQAVTFDQGGTPWSTQGPFTAPVSGIDNGAGKAHLVQVIFVPFAGDLVLFRIRFDVTGVGKTGLTIDPTSTVAIGGNSVVHGNVQSSFSSASLFDSTGLLNWSASFTNSTPISPGGSNSFQATVTGGTGALAYAWQFDSTNTGVFTAEATTNPAIVTLPSTFTGFRITLRVTDTAVPAHVIFLTQHISLTLNVQQPGSPAGTIAVGSTNTFNGFWIGGLPTYSGSWRFCPGLAFQITVCAHPVAPVAATTLQTNAVTGQIYHFGGLYTDSLTITDTEPPSIYTGSITSKLFFLTNVTGTPLAYTLALSSSAISYVPNVPVQFTAVAHYDPTYPVASRSSIIAVKFTFGDGSFTNANILMSTGGANSTTVSHNYVATGTFNALAVGTDGSVSSIQERSSAIVENSPDFSLSAPSPGVLTVIQGATSSSSSITATLTTATTGPVTFSASGLPAGVTMTFMNSPCTPNPTCAATVSFTTTSTATVGLATIKITATGSGATHSTTLSLTVLAAPFDFSLGAPSPGSLTLIQGSTSHTSITATIVSGSSAPVTLSTSTLPTGMTATFTNNPCSPDCTVTVSFSATTTAVIGTTAVVITAIGGGVTHSTTLSLVVAAPPFDFSLGAPSPGSLTVVQGGTSSSSSITATLISGRTAPVSFSTSALPAGVTATFTTSPCSPTCTVTVSFSATPSAAVRTITVSINAAGGGASHSTSLSLTVSAPASGNPSFAATLTSPPSLAGVALVIVLIIAVLAYVRGRRKKPAV